MSLIAKYFRDLKQAAFGKSPAPDISAEGAGIWPRKSFNNNFTIIDDFAKHNTQGLIEDVFAGKLDGIIVRNLVEKDKIQFVQKNISNWNYSKVLPFPFGYCVGQDLFSSEEDLVEYIEEMPGHIKGLNTFFDTEYVSYINSVLKKLSGYNVRPAPRNNNNIYKPSTIRVVEPGKELGFNEHIGNEFMEYMSHYKELRELVYFEDQLSFFMVMKKPESGGELELFDLVWDDTPKSLLENQGSVTKTSERSEYLAKRKNFIIDLEEGDLIVFDGGRIWHRVNPVLGSKERITVGGFIGLARTGKEIYYWS